jgi:hypothetical protein
MMNNQIINVNHIQIYEMHVIVANGHMQFIYLYYKRTGSRGYPFLGRFRQRSLPPSFSFLRCGFHSFSFVLSLPVSFQCDGETCLKGGVFFPCVCLAHALYNLRHRRPRWRLCFFPVAGGVPLSQTSAASPRAKRGNALVCIILANPNLYSHSHSSASGPVGRRSVRPHNTI